MTWPRRLFLAAIVTTATVWGVTALGPLGLLVSAAGFGIGYGAGVLAERWGQP